MSWRPSSTSRRKTCCTQHGTHTWRIHPRRTCRHTQAIKNATLKVQTDYARIIKNALKNAFEYGKNNAAREIGADHPRRAIAGACLEWLNLRTRVASDLVTDFDHQLIPKSRHSTKVDGTLQDLPGKSGKIISVQSDRASVAQYRAAVWRKKHCLRRPSDWPSVHQSAPPKFHASRRVVLNRLTLAHWQHTNQCNHAAILCRNLRCTPVQRFP